MSRHERPAGGVAQRSARHKAASLGLPASAGAGQVRYERIEKGSEVCNELVSLVAWRFISPQLLQKIAAKTLNDVKAVIAVMSPGCTDIDSATQDLLPDLVHLAGLGTSGEYKNNINRDLMRALPPVLVPLSCWKLPLKVSQLQGLHWIHMGIIGILGTIY
jgi:hypothetical protein